MKLEVKNGRIIVDGEGAIVETDSEIASKLDVEIRNTTFKYVPNNFERNVGGIRVSVINPNKEKFAYPFRISIYNGCELGLSRSEKEKDYRAGDILSADDVRKLIGILSDAIAFIKARDEA